MSNRDNASPYVDQGEPLPLVIVGANHRTAPVPIRERLLIEETAQSAVFSGIRSAGIVESLILSTCDRVEIHAIHPDPAEASAALLRILAQHAKLPEAALSPVLYTKHGTAAARHVFAVAASLDSLVVGEPQVLGQVKAGHRAAQAAGMMGGELDALLQAAFGAAKRVRTETDIGERPVSIAAAVTSVARDVHGDLARCAGLMIGLGEMGELVCRALQDSGLGSLAICHRKTARAEALAQSLGANLLNMETLSERLTASEIVITGVGLGSFVLTKSIIGEALRLRRRKPMFVVDLAVPRDSDPSIHDLDDAFLYDLSDLEQITRDALASRETAAESAWRLVDEGLDNHLRLRAMRAAVPCVLALRSHFEAVRNEVLKDIEAGDAATATRLLINRLLHDPSEALREIAAAPEDGVEKNRAGAVLRRLFGLEGETGPDGEKP